jgi:signal transduction histidine kinase
MNIIDNAIRYTKEGGITVRISRQESSVLVEVKDTGAGIDREEKNSLFESFSRGAAGSKYWTGGIGFGLYVAKKYVDMHQGKIWVESEGRGKGSAFYIELPIVSAGGKVSSGSKRA